jgi:hypothetical protein
MKIKRRTRIRPNAAPFFFCAPPRGTTSLPSYPDRGVTISLSISWALLLATHAVTRALVLFVCRDKETFESFSTQPSLVKFSPKNLGELICRRVASSRCLVQPFSITVAETCTSPWEEPAFDLFCPAKILVRKKDASLAPKNASFFLRACRH